jgi:hypothetical protein
MLFLITGKVTARFEKVNIHSTRILLFMPRYPNHLFLQVFQLRFCMPLSACHACYILYPSHNSLSDHLNNMWRGVQIIKQLTIQKLFSTSCTNAEQYTWTRWRCVCDSIWQHIPGWFQATHQLCTCDVRLEWLKKLTVLQACTSYSCILWYIFRG